MDKEKRGLNNLLIIPQIIGGDKNSIIPLIFLIMNTQQFLGVGCLSR
jgi:hypothetical protein